MGGFRVICQSGHAVCDIGRYLFCRQRFRKLNVLGRMDCRVLHDI